MLAAVAAVVLLAAMLARLRRVARPRFEPVAQYDGARAELGRVVLARPGSPGTVLGWSLRCAGREVLARTGATALEPLGARDGAVRVRERATGRVAALELRGCALRWEPAGR